MTQWNADLDRPALSPGAMLTVMSQHRMIRVLPADTLMIEAPDGQRFRMLVLSRSAGEITLVTDDGRSFGIAIVTDDSLHPNRTAADVFSLQIWTAH